MRTRLPAGHTPPAVCRAARSEAGFTLIEVLVAMMIFTVAAMGVAGSMAVAVTSDTHAGEQTRALALASQKLEELKARPFADVQPETARSINVRGEEGPGPYRRAVEVAEGAEGANTKSVSVTVDYGAGRNGTRQVELYTIFYSGS